MRRRGVAGRADLGDLLPLLDELAHLDQELRVVGVHRIESPRVLQHDHLAVARQRSVGVDHPARLGRAHRRALRRADVDALVVLAVAHAERAHDLAAHRPAEFGRPTGPAARVARSVGARRAAALRVHPGHRGRHHQARARRHVAHVVDAVQRHERLDRRAVALRDAVERLARRDGVQRRRGGAGASARLGVRDGRELVPLARALALGSRAGRPAAAGRDQDRQARQREPSGRQSAACGRRCRQT